MSKIAIASLNILGDAYNPFEFMEAVESNATFEGSYSAILASFEAVTSAEVVGEIKALGIDIPENLNLKERFCDNCTEKFLERDNKLALILRTNLVVCATRPIDNGKPLFRCAENWRLFIKQQSEHYLTSGVDIPILFWDVACCLAAEKNLELYTSVCEQSYLNPERLLDNAKKLMEPLIIHENAMLAVQEFPKQGSANRAALLQVLEKSKLAWTEMGDVGFIYSSSIIPAQVVQSPMGVEPGAIVEEVHKMLPDLPPLELSEDELARFRTTARKTLVMDVGADLRIVAVHVKELKTEAGTAFLARYLRAMCDDARMTFLVGDTNIAAPAMAGIFADSAGTCGLALLTRPGCVTTRKRRSALHGQRYDAAKCLRVVAAHKDFILARRGPAVGAGRFAGAEAAEAAAHPDLARDAWRLLPSADWPSDHCMVCVVVDA